MTNACLEGFNGTIFCYGQTGSGKTFTTFGPPESDSLEVSGERGEGGAGGGGSGRGGEFDHLGMSLGRNRGLVPRVLEYLFERFSAVSVGADGTIWR